MTEFDTANHSRLNPSDADNGRRLDGFESFDAHYRRLSGLNQGVYTGKWADQSKLGQQDNLAVLDAVASTLELTPFQHRRSRLLFKQLGERGVIGELSSPGSIDTALVAASVCALVSRIDGRMYHPNRTDDRNDELLTSFMDDRGYSDKSIRSCLNKVSARLPIPEGNGEPFGGDLDD
ncbi:hypothetical protein [Halocatena marina]|uniref:hypothetical protein n=1 Tax=Halocatena marina TaxID=2934937 RepID=UPI0022329973|nr:hypothetical protein [Halocatena marina]